jgi:hypothetical protein
MTIKYNVLVMQRPDGTTYEVREPQGTTSPLSVKLWMEGSVVVSSRVEELEAPLDREETV